MRFRISDFGFRIVFAILLLPVMARAESSALILSGVPGDAPHGKKFAEWTETTKKALVDTFGFTADRIIVLSEMKTSKADIQEAFTRLKQQLKPTDTFFFFMIGHGTYDTVTAADGKPVVDYKLSIYREDFTAKEYSELIGTLSANRVVIVNGTNSSGGGIENLAGKNRIVVTATRSGSEGNDTLFYEHFLKALQDPAADEDKDKKLSVWEAFKYAAASVDRFYKEQTRLATEHSLISDNGSPKVAADAKDIPVMARNTSFQVDRPQTSADSRVQALLNERLVIELELNTLRINKSSMSEAEYEGKLDDLQIRLAKKNQEIKEQEKK